jgi:voltage-gated potassium channel
MEEFEESFQQIIHGLQKRKELIVVTFTLMLICIYISSAMVYQLEHIAQPAVFKSIPDTFWWGVVTLTTIGYGDMIPITPLGRIFSALMFVFGIGIFALPMAIVTAVIIEASANSQQIPFCQNCGEPSFSKEKDKIKS